MNNNPPKEIKVPVYYAKNKGKIYIDMQSMEEDFWHQLTDLVEKYQKKEGK